MVMGGTGAVWRERGLEGVRWTMNAGKLGTTDKL